MIFRLNYIYIYKKRQNRIEKFNKESLSLLQAAVTDKIWLWEKCSNEHAHWSSSVGGCIFVHTIIFLAEFLRITSYLKVMVNPQIWGIPIIPNHSDFYWIFKEFLHYALPVLLPASLKHSFRHTCVPKSLFLILPSAPHSCSLLIRACADIAK